MTKIPKECLVCESPKIKIVNKTRKIAVPFAKTVRQAITVSECKNPLCNAHILVKAEPANVVEKRILESARKSVPSLVKKVSKKVCLSRAERALNLKEGTFEKWAGNPDKVTPVEIAFLRLLATFPEMVRVAEEGYTFKRNDEKKED